MTIHIINKMLGLIFTSVETIDDEIIFGNNQHIFRFYHNQECCEGVYIEDICGDLEDLIGEPILQAEEIGNVRGDGIDYVDYEWTFYKFATINGSITVRWAGTSNGYYGTGVDIEHINLQTKEIECSRD